MCTLLRTISYIIQLQIQLVMNSKKITRKHSISYQSGKTIIVKLAIPRGTEIGSRPSPCFRPLLASQTTYTKFELQLTSPLRHEIVPIVLHGHLG